MGVGFIALGFGGRISVSGVEAAPSNPFPCLSVGLPILLIRGLHESFQPLYKLFRSL